MHNKLKKSFNKLSIISCMFFLYSETVFASSSTLNQEAVSNVKKYMGSVYKILFSILTGAGAIITIWGIYEIIISFKDENPDAKVRGILKMVVGIFLLTLKGILSLMGVFSDYI